MNYVKHFNINGVNTKQVTCIELQGVPNAATEGYVGVLGIDMSSPTHEVYKCVAKNGSIYTWELLSAGMSVIGAKVTGEGAMSYPFSYSDLLVPNGYLIKVGDLILDSEGYLYQISSIGSDFCTTSYSGTHLGGGGAGKDYTLRVIDGKLQLVTGNGNAVSETTYTISDGDTIYRDNATGEICAIGIKTVNGSVLRFFVGEQALYDTLTDAQKSGLFAIITDDPTKERILSVVENFEGLNSSDLRGNGTGFSYKTKGRPEFDRLVEEGHYFSLIGSGLPDGHKDGFLDVDYFDGYDFEPHGEGYTTQVVKQTFRPYDGNQVYVRTGKKLANQDTYTWGEWTQTSGVGTKTSMFYDGWTNVANELAGTKSISIENGVYIIHWSENSQGIIGHTALVTISSDETAYIDWRSGTFLGEQNKIQVGSNSIQSFCLESATTFAYKTIYNVKIKRIM